MIGTDDRLCSFSRIQALTFQTFLDPSRSNQGTIPEESPNFDSIVFLCPRPFRTPVKWAFDSSDCLLQQELTGTKTNHWRRVFSIQRSNLNALSVLFANLCLKWSNQCWSLQCTPRFPFINSQRLLQMAHPSSVPHRSGRASPEISIPESSTVNLK